MTLHNPSQLDPSLAGPHHKLLSTEDLSKPLPEGAQWWSSNSNSWVDSLATKNGALPNESCTYRIPLTLSDRLKAERDRLDEQIRVVEAVEKGAEWECRPASRWTIPADQSVKSLDYCMQMGPVRLKQTPPAPRSIPWTLETRPDGQTWLKGGAFREEFLVLGWCQSGAFILGEGLVSYERLHSDWLQRNGEPAGEKVTV